MTPIRERAPAKVNLYLHILGRRADGLHLLDSLVAFATLADTVTLVPAEGLAVSRGGPMADALPAAPEDDLVMRTAEAMARRFGRPVGARIHLDKRLPVAAGIGGGSSDAAAVIRAVARLWGIDGRDPALAELAAGIGADVPVCLLGRGARVGGVGEVVEPLAGFPPLPAVLVNPNLPLPTGPVFAAYAAGTPPPPAGRPPTVHPGMPAADLVAALAAAANDLSAAAVSLCPGIAAVLDVLARQPGCGCARMSGSGATCFALFADAEGARRAAGAIAREHPGWWVADTLLG